jgi:hypothetical protein
VLRPFLLRRVKSDVERGMPPKKETILKIGMSAVQRKWYAALLQKDIEVGSVWVCVFGGGPLPGCDTLGVGRWRRERDGAAKVGARAGWCMAWRSSCVLHTGTFASRLWLERLGWACWEVQQGGGALI